MTWYLLCTYCDKEIFKTGIESKPRVGDILIAQNWKYVDDRQVEVGDRFFCEDCLVEFQPMIQKVRQSL